MPTKQKLPDGPHREFVEELFTHYRAAGRPPLRTIAEWIKDETQKDPSNPRLRGSASTETIRRAMTGLAVPVNWLTVETILEALCGIAGRNTDEDRWPGDNYRYDDGSRTFKSELQARWNALIDDYESTPPELPPPPAPPAAVRTSSSAADPFNDPWMSGATKGFGGDEEPPF